jgi:protease IV
MVRILALLLTLAMVSCAPKLFKDFSDPLKEFTLEGKANEKVLLVPMRGMITNRPDEGFLRTRPGMVQEVVAHLKKAQEDPRVKAVVLKIESPGGSAVDSDILHHELERYKAESGAKMVALMMSVTASGGYYTALAGDRIVAHPLSVTGSVGTIFVRPKVHGLMDKLGVETEVAKSGPYKDMGSPLRESLPEEREIIQVMIEDLNSRFLELTRKKRTLTDAQFQTISTARIFTARQALEVGLVDTIGYMDDAVNEAKGLAGLPEDARLVVYRRTEYPDDNPYNPITMEGSGSLPNLIGLGLSDFLAAPRTGFYYLWAPEFEKW